MVTSKSDGGIFVKRNVRSAAIITSITIAALWDAGRFSGGAAGKLGDSNSPFGGSYGFSGFTLGKAGWVLRKITDKQLGDVRAESMVIPVELG